jgi:hypothetical protein
MEYQDTKRTLKVVYGHSDSDSDISTNEGRKALHVMCGVPGTIRPGASSRLCTEG